jgi:hypothetical protein
MVDIKKEVYSGVIFLLFVSGSGSSLGSLTSRMPSVIVADAFPVSTLCARAIRNRYKELAQNLGFNLLL